MLQSVRRTLQRSFWYRHLEHGAVLGLHKFLFPLRALYHGGFILPLYTAGLCAGIYFAVTELQAILYQAVLHAGGRARIESTTIAAMLLTMFVLLWILAVPLFLTAVALPIRVLWVHGSLRSTELLSDLLSSMKASLRTLALMARLELRYFVPLILMIALYVPFIRDTPSPAIAHVFRLALITVSVVTIYRALPGLVSPLLAILGRFQGRDAVIFSESILRGKRSELLFIGTCTAAALLGLSVCRHGRVIADPAGFTMLELGMYAVVLWYALTLVSSVILDALRSYSQFSREG